jgi:hypothetical protein
MMKKNKLASEFNEKQIEILTKLFSQFNCWDEYIPPIKETLMKLLLCYIKSEEIEENKVERDNMAINVYMLNDILDQMLLFERVKTQLVKKEEICKECLKKEGEIKALEWIAAEKDKRINELITGSSDNCKMVVIK